MLNRAFALLAACLLLAAPGFAKDKPKVILAADVLNARTVAVVIDPDAGVSLDDPQANRVARADVENAFQKWGRFDPIQSTQDADLIVVLRKGNKHLVNPTITDPRQNRRPGTIEGTDTSVNIGAQRGPRPNDSSIPDAGSADGSPRPQTEVGGREDSFVVYAGRVDHPLDSAPVWRLIAKDGLRPHTVPAVDEFRKAIAEAEKAAAKHP
jgi:hypothetical protein